MNKTCHSEYLKLQTVLIKRAAEAFRSDVIIDEQWKFLNFLEQPHMKKANEEYAQFEALLKDQDIEIMYLPENESLSLDSIYCRDAAIATDHGMILCRMGKKGRHLEPSVQKQFFLKNKISILGEIRAPGTLEGGDVAWLDTNTLAVAHSYRSNMAGIDQLKALLEPKGIKIIVVPLPHYKGPSDVFHLMSIFSPVDVKRAVIYSALMPVSFRNELLQRDYDLIEVPKEEFESMGCNVLTVAPNTCVMVEGNPRTEEMLLSSGCKVFTYSGNHISVMGGGGPTCLTRPLKRRFEG